MRKGYLSEFFQAVAVKRLSQVEVDKSKSNQHEFNGDQNLIAVFGPGDRKTTSPAFFLYLTDDDEKCDTDRGTVTWYDSRRNNPKRASEYRLYYTSNIVNHALSNDFLFLAKRSNDEIVVIIAPKGSSWANQLAWLFGVSLPEPGLANVNEGTDQRRLDVIARDLLEKLGMEVLPDEPGLETKVIDRFGIRFPLTTEFSACAREYAGELAVSQNPDEALMTWMDVEEKMFRIIEKAIVREKLKKGFPDVDDFITFSLSVQNRRKSRAGRAFENHLAAVFDIFGIAYSRGQITEEKKKPDFIFPSIINYYDPGFPEKSLTFLGVKTTCKDRWRQILSEARRIPNKHLATLEPGISENQTSEMISSNVQLVLPASLFESYTEKQRETLINIMQFLELIKGRQRPVN